MTEAGRMAEVGARRGILAPYRIVRDLLAPREVAALLAFAAAHEAEFTPTGVGPGPRAAPNPAVRISRGLRRLGPFKALLRTRMLELAPALIAELRLTPFDISQVELQLVAHGDGAFYARHIDTQVSPEPQQLRVLSGVYYLHREPKAFAGGALRLHAIGDEPRFVDIEPTCNTLVVFPSWAPHEVMPVSVPGGAFMDSRFAVNCWLRRLR